MNNHTMKDNQSTPHSEILSKIRGEISIENNLIAEQTLTVVKRNGQIVPFNRIRIMKAIEAAFRDTKSVESNATLPEELLKTIEDLTLKVTTEVLSLGQKGVSITVEGIQDIVEITLMDNGHHDVARGYIIYRDQHKLARQSQASDLRIYRRDGATLVRFNPMKIAASIERSFRSAQHIQEDNLPEQVIQAVNSLTEEVVQKVFQASADHVETFHVHHIQDMIEEALMKNGFYAEAKAYIIHRASKGQHERPRAQPTHKKFSVNTPDGSLRYITETEILRRIKKACENLPEVSIDELFTSTLSNFYEGIKEQEVDLACIMAARAKVEKEPAYSKVTARLLLDVIYKEVFEVSSLDPQVEKVQRDYFKKYIRKGISYSRLSPRLLEYDLEELSAALKLERDDLFSYLGLQTLYDRYFIHHQERRLESPQIFFMRVAMGLALNEAEKNKRAIEFYDVLSQFYFMSSTPTLFNSGTNHSQLSSCYLSTVYDDLSHIFKVISDDAQLSKWAGGLGNDWTNVRATGSVIKGTNGRSQGVIPFLKVANDTAVAVNQGGKRRGALCSYLETWHLDIEDFLELRKNTGDERRRTHDMNTANWIPDLFMKRVEENGVWTLFSPSDTPDLHDLYGSAFEKRYVEYEKMTETGQLRLFKKVDALSLWRKMLSMLFETGHPWITFKDPSNVRSPQDHRGVVHSSNLCTEILLNTSDKEVAVCNLGSINLAKHIVSGGIDEERLAKTVETAIRMLDNVIDINFYPIVEAGHANKLHRPIGLGFMGFQDALYMLNIPYASHEAVEFSDRSMEMISYYAILSSTKLSAERGTYETYKGSKWDRGLLPIDTIDLLEKERGQPIEIDRKMTMNWDYVRSQVKKYGMRNSNCMAIAPTATIANIIGVTASIEPTYKNLFVKSNLSGEFTVPNTFLVEKLKQYGVWDDEMLDDLKYYDGSILEIERVPEEVKHLFLTSFEIDPDWLIACGAKRQKWIDMGQSLNLYMAEASGKKLHQMYMQAWKQGLKTTYYLRSLGATQIEKSTTDINKRGLQPRWMKSKSASSNVSLDRVEKPKPKACSMEEGCESCQ